MRRVLVASVLLALTTAAPRSETIGLSVEVSNASEPVLCAEKDNVTLNLASREVRRFRIEAAHPAYIGTLAADRWAPDWTDCDISPASSAAPEPRKVIFDGGGNAFLVGFAYDRFWRPNDVLVRVGDRVERGLHIVQLHVRGQGGSEEVLVVYPADGYWRIRPLAPAHLARTSYGSSFLIGPIALDERPVVNLREIAIDPAAMTFTLAFAEGGSATVRVDAVDRDRLALEVAFERPVEGGPFAALRSMYVTEFNADVARVAARAADEQGLARGRDHELRRRACDASLGGPSRALSPQHQRARHDVQPVRRDLADALRPDAGVSERSAEGSRRARLTTLAAAEAARRRGAFRRKRASGDGSPRPSGRTPLRPRRRSGPRRGWPGPGRATSGRRA